jgi:hypothetical protein
MFRRRAISEGPMPRPSKLARRLPRLSALAAMRATLTGPRMYVYRRTTGRRFALSQRVQTLLVAHHAGVLGEHYLCSGRPVNAGDGSWLLR